MKHGIGRLVLAGALAMASFGAGPVAEAADFTLTSPAYRDNAPLARKSAGNCTDNPNCVGENVSPPLAWANPPEGTRSYALLMFDPEGRRGLGVSHMVIYGIPVAVTGFGEGELSKDGDKFVSGRNTLNLGHYFGPFTPPGDWHHYTFTLIATDLDPKALKPGMTRDELLAALGDHAKSAAGLILRFKHPEP